MYAVTRSDYFFLGWFSGGPPLSRGTKRKWVVHRRGGMARRVCLCVLAVLCLCFILQTNVALGQAVFGSVIGSVTDAQGAGVAGAQVTVTSTTKNTVYEATTNDSGNFSVTHLIPD